MPTHRSIESSRQAGARATARKAGVAASLALALALAAALAGCGGGGSTPPPQGTLILSSTPPGASVFVNGADTGEKTPVTIQQAAGSQIQVLMRLAGYDDAVQAVQLGANETVTVDLTLQASRPPSIPPHNITGKVSVLAGGAATPATGAAIEADDGAGGIYPATLVTSGAAAGTYYILVPPGAYTLRVSQAGYEAQTRQVTLVSADDVRTGVDFTLVP